MLRNKITSNKDLDLKTQILMFFFQNVMLAVLAIVCPTLHEFSLATVFFWIYNTFSYTVYFMTTKTSPGFITLQDINMQNKTVPRDNEVRSVSIEEKLTKKPSQYPPPEKRLEVPNPIYEPSPHIVNTNRSENEEEKENTQNNIEISNVDDIQIVEIRHCTICRIDQPLRTKHCRDCGKCVATQDHHCPWLGICIGEKNKKSFYFYLIVQMGQIVWTMALDIESIESTNSVLSWIWINSVNVVLGLLLGIFGIMVGALIGFHLYLASTNLTTWEFLSWSKISYLKGLDKRMGSPFSNGVCSNLYNNCIRRIPKYFTVWEISKNDNSH